MNLITAFQYASFKFTQALMDAGVMLYVANTTNETHTHVNNTLTHLRGLPVSVVDTLETTPMPVDHEDPVVLVDQVALQNQTTSTNTTSMPPTSNKYRLPMPELHVGIILLMCIMLLILGLTCCIRCVRRRRIKTVPKRSTRHSSARHPRRSGN